MSTIPSLKFEPLAYNTGIVYSQLPTDGTGDFTVARNTICQEINSVGASVDVAVNVPRYDFKAPYVAPVDNSYYSYDSSSVTGLNTPFSAGSGDFSISEKINTGVLSGSDKFVITGAINSFGIFIRSTGKFVVSLINTSDLGDSTPTLLDNTDYTIGYTKTGTVGKYYLNGLVVDTVVDSNNYTGLTSSLGAVGLSLSSYYWGQFDNFGLSESEMLDRHNGLPIPEKYVGANNVDLLNGWDFTSGWSQTGAVTIVTSTGFTTSSSGGLYINLGLKEGFSYRIDINPDVLTSGTITINAGTGGNTLASSITTGASSVNVDVTSIGGSGDFYIKTSSGSTVNFLDIKITKLGNTLNLSTGKTASTWYDLDHAIQGAVTGATLTNSIDFGNNIHLLLTCPVLRTETSFTNYFINSSTPVTQTITTVIGTKYTFNCKGLGLATFDEVGGNGVGGTFTEVYPNTYTATATSVTVTLAGGHAFDFVQLSNTSSAMNHVPTAGVSVTKAQDAITLGGDVNSFDSTSGVLEVKMSALELGGAFRLISISDGTTSNRAYLGYGDDEGELIFGVDVGGATSYFHSQLNVDTTVENIFRLKWSNSDFGVKIGVDENNMVEVGSQSSGVVPSAGTFDRLNLNNGSSSFSLDALTSSLITYKGITQY